jgi:hypothetical protein
VIAYRIQERNSLHVHVSVFSGPALGQLELAGVLIFTLDEWKAEIETRLRTCFDDMDDPGMPEQRFIVRDDPDDEWHEGCQQLVDTLTGAVYYAGGGEPEDQTIGRDWSWVPVLLNQLAEQVRP